MRDSSVLVSCLAAPSSLPGRLRQQGLLKDSSMTAAGMPLQCPQRMKHGLQEHRSGQHPSSQPCVRGQALVTLTQSVIYILEMCSRANAKVLNDNIKKLEFIS